MASIGEVCVDHGHGVAVGGEALATARHRRWVAVDGDHPSAGQHALDERRGHAATTEGAVDHDLSRPGLQALYEWV
jgi:hypothetical protein